MKFPIRPDYVRITEADGSITLTFAPLPMAAARHHMRKRAAELREIEYAKIREKRGPKYGRRK